MLCLPDENPALPVCFVGSFIDRLFDHDEQREAGFVED